MVVFMHKIVKSKLYCLFHLAQYRHFNQQKKSKKYLLLTDKDKGIESEIGSEVNNIQFFDLHNLKNFFEKILTLYNASIIKQNYNRQRQLINIMNILLLNYIALQKKQGDLFPKIRVKLSCFIQIHRKKECYTNLVLKLVK